MILVEKNGQRKTVTEYAYKLMGREKSGWVPVESSAEVSNVVAPPSGEASPTQTMVSNTLEIKEETHEEETPSGEASPTIEELTAEFKELAKANVNTAQIKDYLDEKNIKYKQSAKIDALIELLFIEMSGNVDLLKSTFNL